jgi:hypothetical protein
VGAYLALEKSVVNIFGFTDDTSVTAEDSECHYTLAKIPRILNPLLVVYNMYLDFGVLGLQALKHYDDVGEVCLLSSIIEFEINKNRPGLSLTHVVGMQSCRCY